MTNTREQILGAAGRLVHVRGFNDASVEDILKESDAGKANFYYYFKNDGQTV